ncbi:MAG: SDR family oxidoreductase [Gammaproteobacteria bacterium]|jgi:nucleoside-diphosphate-sugar epimerase|nr:SDR family oxidoreductase [Gammaproteobacteria bacterium]MBT5223000.1 SDR family oxidoreductase [Gammaproteobacteria bacterium]MBT5825599.1 SDR family oxidoreductase [Gammaproteobacteria bacterium]MBT5966651.1 SDR family oxidoreductase [Gammaproteobacteria bacterium]MBT6420272.1 SDR family oxidoreductase [Gammaproteobacteria bacterium]
MEKVLVTGATGFIGKALVQTLVAQQFNVVAGVRQIDESQSDAQIELGDLCAATDFSAVLQDIDVVIHLAARAHIMHNRASDPLAAFRKVNTAGTLNLAIQAAEAGVKRFIFISSIKVNGELTTSNAAFQVELIAPPLDPYALSKYEAEQGLMSLTHSTSMQVVIIRPPLVYGPDVKANFAKMINWLAKGIPLPFGAIHNKRSLIALDNLLSFIMLCITHPKATNEVFLIADGEDVSTTQLLQKIAHALHKKSVLVPVPVSWMRIVAALCGKQEVANRLFTSLQVDSSKATALLGWEPVISIDKQLQKMTDSYSS